MREALLSVMEAGLTPEKLPLKKSAIEAAPKLNMEPHFLGWSPQSLAFAIELCTVTLEKHYNTIFPLRKAIDEAKFLNI
jgi:hypothetical protein